MHYFSIIFIILIIFPLTCCFSSQNANIDYEGEDEYPGEMNGNEDGFSSNNSNQDISHMSGGSDANTQVVQSNKTVEGK